MLDLAMTAAFARSLVSPGPYQGHGKPMALYEGLIGSWDVEVVDHLGEGARRVHQGEWHCAWVLEGRAIQDVLVVPRPGDRKAGVVETGNRYGTTLRYYDPGAGAWQIIWVNPVTGARAILVARPVGDEIVQEGWQEERPVRWVFSNLTPRSFHWRGEESRDGGMTWHLMVELFGTRRTAA